MNPQYRSMHPVGRKIGLLMVFFFIVGSMWMTYLLFRENRWYPALGWAILSLIFLFFMVWALIPAPKGSCRIMSMLKVESPRVTGDPNALVPVFRSKDSLMITAASQALHDEGIEAVSLDQHAGHMLQFLADVEMMIAVSERDAEKSVAILRNLHFEV